MSKTAIIRFFIFFPSIVFTLILYVCELQRGAPFLMTFLEAITNIADGLDKHGIARIRFDFASQRRHAPVNAAVRNDDLAAPNAIQNRISCEGASAILQQKFQKFEFLRGQLDLTAIPEQFVGGQIEAAITKTIIHVFRSSPAQKRLHPGKQLSNTEWLGDIIVCAELEAADDIILLAFGREHNDR